MKNLLQRRVWHTLSAKVVHKNPWYHIVHETFVTPVRTIGNYFIVTPHGTGKSVAIVPIVDGKIIFVQQYRYVLKKRQLELPTGGTERGYTSYRAAQKELYEETGYRATKLEKVGAFFPWSGPLREQCTVYLATTFSSVGAQCLEETEVGMKVVPIEIAAAYAMVDAGTITDGMTLATLALVRHKILS